MERLVVGISGASGSIYGVRLLQALRDLPVEVHLVVSEGARRVVRMEGGADFAEVEMLADQVYSNADVSATIASGSFRTTGMVVVPCSIKSLSSIANSYNDNLLTRAADVTLKEGRKLVLMVRETPRHLGLLSKWKSGGEMRDLEVYRIQLERVAFTDNTTGLFGREILELGRDSQKREQSVAVIATPAIRTPAAIAISA